MHVLQSKSDLCRIEPRPVLCEAPYLAQVEEQLPSSAVVQDEEELVCGL
jgi:hypothetical protein